MNPSVQAPKNLRSEQIFAGARREDARVHCRVFKQGEW